MFADAVKAFLEFLKLAPRYLIALGIMAAFLLFADEEYLKRIGVLEFAQEKRSILGLTLVVTVSLFIVSIVADILSFVKGKWRKWISWRHIIDRLHCLTEDEKQILRFYIAEQTRANVLRYDDGVVQGLVFDGIIFRSSTVGSMFEGFSHNISEYAWNYLNTHPQLLEGTTTTYRSDKRRNVF